MNLGQLKAAIRGLIGDDYNTIVTDSQLIAFINLSYLHVRRKLMSGGLYTDLQTINVDFVAGTQESFLQTEGTSTEIERIVCVQESVSLQEIPVRDKEAAIRSDEQSVYVASSMQVVGGDKRQRIKLGWHTVPTTNFTLIVTYIPKCTEFLSIDVDTRRLDDVPPQYQDLVVFYAPVLILARDEDRADAAATLYSEKLSDVVSESTFSNTKSRGVVDVYEDQ